MARRISSTRRLPTDNLILRDLLIDLNNPPKPGAVNHNRFTASKDPQSEKSCQRQRQIHPLYNTTQKERSWKTRKRSRPKPFNIEPTSDEMLSIEHTCFTSDSGELI